MINYWGYEAEEHQVTTDDDYVLIMHRIPRPGGYPVFLAHCYLCSSGVYSFGPPDNSLAYMLSDAGYDVWMGNTRGNTWSHAHKDLPTGPFEAEYWDFEWGLTGIEDYSAEVDHVLEQTGFDDLFLVGYSMGTTQYFVFLSELPEYNEKVKAGFMMAPATFSSNSTNVDEYEATLKVYDAFHDVRGYEFLSMSKFFHCVSHEICGVESRQHICVDIFDEILGVSRAKLNASMITFYIDHLPAGGTLKMSDHYMQIPLLHDGEFVKFDLLNATDNEESYGSPTPPNYDLDKVTTYTSLYIGAEDGNSVEDCGVLAQRLPNSKSTIIAGHDFSHLDFFANIDVGKLVYKPIVAEMNEILKEDKTTETPTEKPTECPCQSENAAFTIRSKPQYFMIMLMLLSYFTSH